MTTSTSTPKIPRKKKKDMTDEEVAAASLTRNMGTLTDSQRQLASLLLHTNYTQDRLHEGKIVPFTWPRAAEIMRAIDYCINSREYTELYGTEMLREVMKDFKETFPYDRQKWDNRRQFVSRESARDINGKAPGIGIVLLPIDPSRQKPATQCVDSLSDNVDSM